MKKKEYIKPQMSSMEMESELALVTLSQYGTESDRHGGIVEDSYTDDDDDWGGM